MYNQIFELQAGLLKALAHPKRLEIINLIRDQELPVCDIHTMLDLPQSNISQHLMILRNMGVVIARRQGKQIYYKLSNPGIIKANDLLRQVLIDQHGHLSDESIIKMRDLVPLVHDPVCGMRVSPKTAGFHTTYNGRDYYFCASGCLKQFKQEPKTYVK